MAQQTITAFFDSRADATNAVEKLAEAGITRTSIRLLPEQEGLTGSAVASPYDYERDEKGFWATLGDMLIPEEDRATYSEGMHRGGTTVIVTVDEAHVDRAADILEEHGSVNLDEREESWRQEGWTGYRFAAGGSGSAVGTSAVDAPPAAGTSDRAGTQRFPSSKRKCEWVSARSKAAASRCALTWSKLRSRSRCRSGRRRYTSRGGRLIVSSPMPLTQTRFAIVRSRWRSAMRRPLCQRRLASRRKWSSARRLSSARKPYPTRSAEPRSISTTAARRVLQAA